MSLSKRVAARYLGHPIPSAHRPKTAAYPPMPPKQEGTVASRQIPKDHEFNKKALKPLAKALWASTVSLGHALTAYRHLSRLKSTTVSPDGRLGGMGYVMNLGDMRQKLFEASEALSSISDTIYDEITAPHWKPKLAQLDDSDREDVSRFVQEAEEVMENPEGEAEEGIEEIEEKAEKKDKKTVVEEDSSTLPQGENHQEEVSKEPRVKQAATLEDFGGPRVNQRGPGTGDGAYGDFNGDDTLPHDQWSMDGGGLGRRDEGGEDYDYTSEWENDLSVSAVAIYPDANTDPTSTDAWDFGIGYGAEGDGAGGYPNPTEEGKGVWGPHSGLPGSPGQSSGDSTTEVLDDKINDREAALDYLYGGTSLDSYDYSLLPQDAAGPPARSDYYPGAKDNMVSVGTSEMPGSPRVEGVEPQSMVDMYSKDEDLNTEYVRYDYSTKTLREPSGQYPGQNHQEPWAPDGELTR